MCSIKIPAFGEENYREATIDWRVRTVQILDVDPDQFVRYSEMLLHSGFTLRQEEILEHRSFRAFEKDGSGVFVNYFAGTQQLQFVTEENCTYFSYEDQCGPVCTTPRVTQVLLSDYGLADVIRLSDGRLILIDGANLIEEDVDHFFERIKQDSVFEKPVIAAWIMSHPHSDHYWCFFPFMKKYGDQVVLEKLFYHFPAWNDNAHYDKLDRVSLRFAQWLGVQSITWGEVITLFHREVEKLGVPVYTPHAGQSYRVGDAKLQFYSALDDTIHVSRHLNGTSLMFTMELGGQRIFFSTDGAYSSASLAERYGRELKSDILQVPHHGFGSGTYQGQIAGFRYIAPRVCLLPVDKLLAYTSFTTYREGTAFLMCRQDIDEMLTGEKDQVLDLPYTPDPTGKAELEARFIRGRDDSGARSWIFHDLHTATAEDFVFCALNTTYLPSVITAELYFEATPGTVLRQTYTAGPLGLCRLNCMQQPDGTPIPEIPEDTAFSVRFLCSLPVVISHKTHAPAYRSSTVCG